MAFAGEDSYIAWQRVKIALAGADPLVVRVFKELKAQLSQVKGNPNLQYVPYNTAQITTNGGYSPDVDAAMVLGFYAKGARTTGTTAAFVDLHDATSNGATTTTIAGFKFNLTGQEYAAVFASGFRLTTELTISGATTVGGATESTAADTANGFVLLKA